MRFEKLPFLKVGAEEGQFEFIIEFPSENITLVALGVAVNLNEFESIVATAKAATSDVSDKVMQAVSTGVGLKSELKDRLTVLATRHAAELLSAQAVALNALGKLRVARTVAANVVAQVKERIGIA